MASLEEDIGVRVNANIASLTAQRHLASSTRAIARALERLSTGKRINRAGDDAAGLAIATRLQSEARAYLQGVRNINESQSYLNVADGVLSDQIQIVHRMRELALQAANGTLSQSERTYLDNEFSELRAEFVRLNQSTTLNGTNLFDGSLSQAGIQVGPQREHTIELNLPELMPAHMGEVSEVSANGEFAATGTSYSGSAAFKYSVLLEDLNDDGNLDSIVGVQNQQKIEVRFGDGSGALGSPVSLNTGETVYDVAAGDIDGDGDVDLIAGNNSLHVFVNNGSGSFSGGGTLTTSSDIARQTSLEDFNHDGNLDLLAVRTGSAPIEIYLGNGDGTFDAAITYAGFATDSIRRGDVGDLNGDSHLDIMTVSTGGIHVYLGNGNGTFQASTTVATSGGLTFSELHDVNGDSVLDIMIANSASDRVGILMGIGNGTFGAATWYNINDGNISVSGGDFDADGDIDFVTSDNASYVSVYYNQGNGTFANLATFAVPVAARFLTVGDLNNDGALDITAVEQNAGHTQYVLLGDTDTEVTNSLILANLETQMSAEDSLEVLDGTLTELLSARAYIGALQNRLTAAADNNLMLTENLSNARSQILDADLALETSELTRAQILQQAGVSVLGQANLSLQIALQLLTL